MYRLGKITTKSIQNIVLQHNYRNTYRQNKEVLVYDGNNAEVGELEDLVHDPHDVGQDV